MRPVSLLSAALCGVFWTSSNIILGVVAQPPPVQTTTTAGLEVCNQYIGDECISLCNSGATQGPFTDNCLTSSTISFTGTQTPTGTGISTATSMSRITTTSTSFGPGGTILTIVTVTLEPVTITNLIGPSLSTYIITRTVSPEGSLNINTIAIATSLSEPAVNTQTATLASSDSSSEKKSSKSNIGAIVGGVVGGVAVIALIALAIFFFRRRRHQSGTPRDGFGGLEKNRELSTPSVYPSPAPQAMAYDNPTSAPPQNVTPGEAHALMSGYPETQPTGQVVPVVGAQKPYVVGSTEREVDEDGVSLRSPSPTLPDEGAGRGRDFVPRLPIYNRGSDETPRGPAL